MAASDDKKQNVFFMLDKNEDNFHAISTTTSSLLYGSEETQASPQLTLIIPTYKRGELFREALKSAISQQSVLFSWEIVIVDNTEADENGETPVLQIVRECGDSRIRYYHNEENLGMFGNWNRGVELARGEWVSFLHDDDVLCPDAMANIGRILLFAEKQLPRLGYIHARKAEFTHDFNPEEARRHDKKFLTRLTRIDALIYGYSPTCIPSCGTTILKHAYMETGGADARYGSIADAVLGYQIMKHYDVVMSDRVLGGYRWQDNETLQKKTVLDFVERDLQFARYRYSLTFWSRLFGLLFWRIQHNRNIEGKLKLAQRGHHDMDIYEFDFVVPYKKSSLLNVFIYKIIYKIYHNIKKMNRIYIDKIL